MTWPPDKLGGHAHPPLAVLHPNHADAEELVRRQLVVDVDVLLPQLVVDGHDGPVVSVQTARQHLQKMAHLFTAMG